MENLVTAGKVERTRARERQNITGTGCLLATDEKEVKAGLNLVQTTGNRERNRSPVVVNIEIRGT